MSKHTPGPWHVVSDEAVKVTDNFGATLATATFVHLQGRRVPSEVEANATLMAAAPELLEALKELLAAELAIFPSAEAGKEAQDAWADRRAAARNNAAFVIAKATGAV